MKIIIIKAASLSTNTEKNFISKLKQEAGVTYVNKMMEMMNDLEKNKKEIDAYKLSASKGVPNGIKFDVRVISQSAWEINKKSMEKIELPKFLSTCLEDFENFYLKKHSGQKLMWEEIINKGYDSIKFIEYLVQCKGEGGENINNWPITDLKNAIKDFIYLSDNSKKENKKEDKENSIKESPDKNVQENNIDLSAPSAPKQKNLDKLYEESKNDDNIYINVNKRNNKNIINWKLKDSIKITKEKEKEKKEDEYSKTLNENKKELNKKIIKRCR